MTCKICKTNPYQNKLCERCFSLYFEKKFRKELREGPIKKGDKVYLENTKDSNYDVLKLLLEQLKYFVEVVDKKSGAIIIIPSSSEHRIASFVERFSGDKMKKETLLSMPTTLTQDEIESYAKLQGIKIRKSKLATKKQEDIINEIHKLDKKYSGILAGMTKSIKEIDRFFK